MFLEDGAFIVSLEPVHSFLLGNLVSVSDLSSLGLLLADSESRSLEDNVEVHTEDTGGWVVLHAQIDVLLNTESEASRIGEISSLQFEFLDLKGSLEDFLCSVTSDGNVDSDLITSSDSERSDGVSALGHDRLVTIGKILRKTARLP